MCRVCVRGKYALFAADTSAFRATRFSSAARMSGDAERELFNAELNLTQTKRNELLSLVQLYEALGGGWQ